MTPDEIATLRTDFLAFSQYMFKARRGTDMMAAPFHVDICNALERCVTGQTTRLIINIPPRSGKTEFAVKAYIAWCMGNWPDSKFIHASYSKTLASSNTSDVRALMRHDAWADVFGNPSLRTDSNAKDHFQTDKGGEVYATGTEGSITGFGAGLMRDEFGGCFPSDQLVETEHGPIEIGEIVRLGQPIRVWSYNEKEKNYELRHVQRFWRNPANDIVEVGISDGSTFRCTPDHEILTDEGWSSAIHLSQPFDLVNGKPGSITGCLAGERPVICDLDDAIAMLWPCVPHGVRQIICDRLPRLSKFDLPDNTCDNSELLSQSLATIGALEYFSNAGAAEFCAGPLFENGECPVSKGVLHILRLCAIREVQQSIVRGIPVKVPDLVAFRSIANEVLRDQVRYVSQRDFPMDGEIDAIVTLPVARRLQKSKGNGAANSAHVGNLVNAFGPDDRKPVFVRYDGHVGETFCLEVEGNHNFILAQSGAVVSNCIIIDDPHKAGEGNSDTMRKNVIDWFSVTMESRLNNLNTPIIVIMQRLHEADLSGWLLGGGNGEEWEHLCIEAIKPDGSSFWEENSNFSIDNLRRKEKSNSYVFAGQYMQRPSPIGGGILKDAWWKYWTHQPKYEWRSIYADTAQKTKENNDYSVFQCWGTTKDGGKYLIDQLRGKWEAPELLVNARAFWSKHKAIPSKEYGALRSMKVEDKVSGTGLIQTLERERIPIVGIKRSIDKITRAYDAAPIIETGNVYLPQDAPWLSDFLAEASSFPNGKHDDQLDPMFDAVVDAPSYTKWAGAV